MRSLSRNLTIWLFGVFVFSATTMHAQQSPYAGQQNRNIKALSPEQRESYLEGHGMGFAKAAELNHYPGPKHVIELSTELGLSEGQMGKIGAIFNEMQQEAKRLGEVIVNKEEQLDKLFNAVEMDQDKLQELIMSISDLNGKLRLTHLIAHVKMKSILTSDQIQRYDALRGYSSGQHDDPSRHKAVRH